MSLHNRYSRTDYEDVDEKTYKKTQRLLRFRNAINLIFMLLAVVAIVIESFGIFYSSTGQSLHGESMKTLGFYVAIVAVVFKMIEVSLRLGPQNHWQKSNRRRNKHRF